MKKVLLIFVFALFLAGAYAQNTTNTTNGSLDSGLYGCPNDSLDCSNGVKVYRDPSNSCEFPACPDSVDCFNEGEMCGGIAGFVCCNGLRCELEGDYPDAAGTCVADLPGDICEDKCGDGVCDEVVCQGADCPCAETAESCPADCSVFGGGDDEDEEGGISMWYLFVGLVILVFLVIVGLKIAKWLFWSAIIAAILLVLLYVFVL